jgi:hypothetical protein
MAEQSPRQISGKRSGGPSGVDASQQAHLDPGSKQPIADRPVGEHRADAQILATLLWNTERQVRNDLAEHLRRCPYLPPSLAATLANDAEQSERSTIEGTVSGNSILARLFQDPEVPGSGLDPASGQPRLPLQITDQLITEVSDGLREGLIERHGLPPELADEIVMHGRERTLSRSINALDPDAEIDQLVAALSARAALTPTLLLRSLCLGRLQFFTSAMAALADMPRAAATAMLFHGSVAKLLQIYERSGLPLDLFRAFRTTIEMICGLSPEQTGDWQREYTNLIIARLVNEYEQVCPEDLEHVMSQLSRRMAETPGT